LLTRDKPHDVDAYERYRHNNSDIVSVYNM